MCWRNRWVAAALLVSGALQACALAWPWSWGFDEGQAVPVLYATSLIPLVWALRQAVSGRQAAWRAWWYATAWLVSTFWWLYVSMHTYGGLPAPLAALAVCLLAAALATYYGLAGGLAWWLSQRAPRLWPVVLAAAWTLAELARAWLWTGFPWGAGGYALVDSAGWLAPYLGVYGLGAVVLCGVAWLAGAGPGALWRPQTVWGGLLGGCLLLWPFVGRELTARLPTWTESQGRLPAVLLQGNIPQDDKFRADTGLPLALSWYATQARLALAGLGGTPGLVVAPETAIPVLPQNLDPAYWQGYEAMAAPSGAALLLGVPWGDQARGYTNAAVAWAPGVTGMYRYDKHHLVPFGEFVPPLFRWFTNLMQIPLGDFQRGGLPQPPLPLDGQWVAPNICYEDLFGEELARGLVGPGPAPTVLVNLSNIAWFGQTVAVDQHRQIARMRALELQRPMLRATNTGATVAIDHLGRVTHALEPHTRGVLRVDVDGRSGLTPYAWWAGHMGLWPVFTCCVLVLGWAWRTRFASSRG
ncbi:MAG: hypothetical protein RJA09_2640 [Pseudomonadota bacterium]